MNSSEYACTAAPNQIGGSCIQPKYQQHRLIIDLGLPLDAGGDQLNNVPDTLNLMPADEGRLSAIISHAHIDHYGLARNLPAETEIYIGKATRRLFRPASRLSASLTSGCKVKLFWQTVRLLA